MRHEIGGDPTGTGSGGKSVFEGGKAFVDEFHPLLRHSARGMLSMANKGPNTNTSQFFITYAAAGHLDDKHTVFGKMVGGEKILDLCEGVGTDLGDKPTSDIKILEIKVITDPFDEVLLKEKRIKEEKKRKLEERELKQKLVHASSGSTLSTDKVGKFLNNSSTTTSTTATATAGDSLDSFLPNINPNPKKRKTGNSFGDFGGW